MFDTTNATHYIFAFSLIALASYFGNNFKKAFETKGEEDELIRKYLLNESPLYGYNKPKLWIHSKTELNARKWKSFQSRSSTDLNQPYLHVAIKTIINHCGDDFNVCLIDDESFSHLIPSWDIHVDTVAEPMKSHYRELAIAQLLYIYGGMVVPNSFICTKNLKGFYDQATVDNLPFVCENINHTVNLAKQNHKMLFVPDVNFMGALKNDATMHDMVEYLKRRNMNPHFSSEVEFLGESAQWCIEQIQKHKMNLVGGELIGVKTNGRKTIGLEDLLSDTYLDLTPNLVGIYIPAEELLMRTKYQWFAVLSEADLFKSNAIIAKYMMASIVDTSSEYYGHKKGEIRSVISI